MDWALASKWLSEASAQRSDKRKALLDTLRLDEEAVADFVATQLLREDETSFMATTAESANGSAAPRFAPGDRIGPWRVEDTLGTGGMGSVYRAVRDDGTFEQVAALKVLAREDEGLAARFLDERQRLAQLEHPGIARIIDGGQDAAGYPYMAVEYVDGAPIDAYCETHSTSRGNKLKLLDRLCQALSHSHALLILHRDIKPGNVLVNEAGEVRLIDFGIAYSLKGTQSSAPGPLTFATAAPEQLQGEAITVATDIFQVGMLAHKLLTQRWPQRKSEGGVAIDRTAIGSADLAAILARALEFAPEDRYASIDALADDLRAYVSGAPVVAREGGALYRIGKTVTRYKVASAALVLGLTALLSGLVVSIVQRNEAVAARKETEMYLDAANFSGMTGRANQAILEKAFASPEDQARLNSFMLEYAKDLIAGLSDAPPQDSRSLMVIATNMNRAGRCNRTLQVVEPWIESGLGVDQDLSIAQGHAGNCYLQQGEFAKAEKSLRTSLEWERENNSAFALAPGSAITFQRIALSTLETADIEAYEAAALRVKNEFREDAFYSYFVMVDADLYTRTSTYAGAAQTFAELGDLARKRERWSMGFYDAGLVRLAEFRLAYENDAGATRALIHQIEDLLGDDEKTSARARLSTLGAALDIRAGNYAEAAERFARSRAFRATLFGPDHYPTYRLALFEAYALKKSGQSERAKDILGALKSEVLARDERTQGFAAFLAGFLAKQSASTKIAPPDATWPCTDPVLQVIASDVEGFESAKARYCRA